MGMEVSIQVENSAAGASSSGRDVQGQLENPWISLPACWEGLGYFFVLLSLHVFIYFVV